MVKFNVKYLCNADIKQQYHINTVKSFAILKN
jgi:hypothetical protein